MDQGTQGQQTQGDGGQGGGSGAGGGGQAFSLDAPFDVNAIAEADRPLFAGRNIAKIGDVANWAVDAEKRAMAGGKLTLDAKLDPALLPPEYQKIFAAKKLETVQALADQVVNGEKLIGQLGDKPIARPEAGKLVEWFGKNGEALGKPKEAKDYTWNKPQMPEGVEWDEAMDAKFRDFAHQRHLPNELFQDFADFGAQMRLDMIAGAKAETEKQKTELQAGLKQEWGSALPKNVEIAQFAARQLGLEGPQLDMINHELGAPGLVKLMHAIGSKMEGASLITGDGKSAVGAKAEAQATLERLAKDPAHQTALNEYGHAAHASAVAEQEKLMKIIHGA